MSNLVISRDKEGNVTSNGYEINNIFLRHGLSSVYGDYSVPMGLVLISAAIPSGPCPSPKTEKCDTVTEAVYDKLVALACASPRRPHKTRRRNKGSKNKTKKI